MNQVITLRGPEPVWTCDADGHWFQQTRTRIREGNGWREVVKPDSAALIVIVQNSRKETTNAP